MQGFNINSLLDDPLAGCLPIVQEVANGTNLLRGVLMRLRIYHSEAISTAIGDQVIAEAKEMITNRWEYVINEALYELRRAGNNFNPMYETAVLGNWAKELLKRHEADAVLEFISAVKKNREKRKR